MIKLRIEDASLLRMQYDREVDQWFAAAGSQNHSFNQTSAVLPSKRIDFKIYDQFKRLSREASRIFDYVFKIEENKTDILDKLFGLVDEFIDVTYSERQLLLDSIAKLQTAAGNSRVRSSSQQASQQLEQQSTVDATRIRQERRNNSLAKARDSKPPISHNDFEEAGAQAEKLSSVLAQIEKYRDVCPPATSEARSIYKVLINEIEAAIKEGKRRDSLASSKDKEQSQEYSQLKKLIAEQNKDKLLLEKKCENRKTSLKKLYFIVVEKDKHLKCACDALEKLKAGASEMTERIQLESAEQAARIQEMTEKVLRIMNTFIAFCSSLKHPEQLQYFLGDGSLEYSFTRRNDALYRSSLMRAGNRSYQEEPIVEFRERRLNAAVDSDPFAEVDEATANILELAREKLSLSEDDEAASNFRLAVRIMHDWADLTEAFEQERDEKQRAFDDKASIQKSMDEREKVHSAVMRELLALKNSMNRDQDKQSKAEETMHVEIKRVLEENNQLLAENRRLENLLATIKSKSKTQLDKKLHEDRSTMTDSLKSKDFQSMAGSSKELQQQSTQTDDSSRHELEALAQTLQSLEQDNSRLTTELESLKSKQKAANQIQMPAPPSRPPRSTSPSPQTYLSTIDKLNDKLSLYEIRIERMEAEKREILETNLCAVASLRDLIEVIKQQNSSDTDAVTSDLQTTFSHMRHFASEIARKQQAKIDQMTQQVRAAEERTQQELAVQNQTQLKDIAELKHLRQQNQELELEKTSLEEIIQDKHFEITELQTKLEDLQSEHELLLRKRDGDINQGIRELQDDVDSATKIMASLREDLSESHKQKDKLAQLNDSMNDQIKQLQLAITEASRAASLEKDSHIAELQQLNSQQQAAVDLLASQISSLQTDKATLQHQLEDLHRIQETAQTFEREVQGLKESNAHLIKQNFDLKTDADAMRKLNTDSSEEIKRLQVQLTSYSSSKDENSKLIGDLSNKLKAALEDANLKQHKIDQLSQQVDTIAALTQTLESLQHQIAICKKDLEAKDSTIDELREQLRVESEELIRSNQQLQETEESLAADKQSNLKLREQVNTFQSTIDALNADKTSLERDLKAANESSSLWQRKFESSEEDCRSLEQEKTELSRVLKDKVAELDDLYLSKIQCEAKNSSQATLIEELKSLIAQRDQTISQSSSSLTSLKQSSKLDHQKQANLIKSLEDKLAATKEDLKRLSDEASDLRGQLLLKKSESDEQTAVIQKLQQDNDSLKVELRQQDEARQSLEAEAGEMKVTIQELQQNEERLSIVIDEKDTEIRHYVEMNQELDEVRRRNDELEADTKRQTQELRKHHFEISNLNAFIEVLRDEIRRQRDIVKAAVAKQDEAEQSLAEIKTKTLAERAELDISLKAEFEKLLTTIRSKDELIQQAEKKTSAVELQLQQLTSQMNAKRSHSAKLESSISDLQALQAKTQADAEAQTKTFQATLNERNDSITSLNNSVSSLKQKLLASEEVVSIIKLAAVDKDNQITSLTVRTGQLEKANENLETIVKGLRETLSLKDAEVQALQTAIKETTTSYEDEKHALEELIIESTEEIERVTRDVQSKDQKILQLQEEKDELREKVGQLEVQVAQMNKELSSKIKDAGGVIKSKDSQIISLNQSLKAKEAEIESLKAQVISTDNKFENLNIELELQVTKVMRLTEDLERLGVELDSHSTDLRKERETTKTQKTQIAEKDKEIRLLNEKANKNFEISNDKSAYIESMKKDLDEKEKLIKEHQASIKKHQEDSVLATTRMNDRDAKILDLSSQLTALTAKLAALKSSNEELKKERDGLETDVGIERKNNRQLTSTIATLEADLSKLRTVSSNQENKITSLQLDNQTLSKQLEAFKQIDELSTEESRKRKIAEESIEAIKKVLEQERTEFRVKETKFESERSEWNKFKQDAENNTIKAQATLKSLEAEKKAVLDEKKAAESALEAAKSKKAELLEQLNKKDEEIADCLKQLQGEKRLRLKEEQEKKAKSDQILELKDMLNESYSNYEVIKLELAEANGKLTASESLRDQLEVLAQNNQDMTQQLIQKTQDFESQKRKTREAEIQVERLTEELVRVKEERNKGDDYLTKQQAIAAKLSEDLEATVIERNKLKKDSEQEISSLKSLVKELQEKEKLKDAMITDYNQMVKDAKEEAKKVQDLLESKNKDIISLTTKYEQKLSTARSDQDQANNQLAQTTAHMQRQKKELDDLNRELASLKDQEKKQLEEVKKQATNLDLEKSELGGRLKELSSTLDKCSNRLEEEKRQTTKLKSDMETETRRRNEVETENVKLKSQILDLKSNPIVKYRDLDRQLLWKHLFLKAEHLKMKTVQAILLLKFFRSKLFKSKCKSLEAENNKLYQNIMLQTKKLIEREENRADIENMLTHKESELDAVIISKTLKSDFDQSVPHLSTEGRQKTDMKAHRHILKDILSVFKDFLQIKVPPIDSVNDVAWDSFIPSLKKHLADLLQSIRALREDKEDIQSEVEEYKQLIDFQTKEIARLNQAQPQAHGSSRLLSTAFLRLAIIHQQTLVRQEQGAESAERFPGMTQVTSPSTSTRATSASSLARQT